MGASSGNITNCIISNNYQGAAALLNVINCIIDSSTTFGIHDSGSGVISNSKIRYDSVGIYGHHSIDNCIITHHKFGIVISSTVEITNCTIDSNYIGILNGRYYSLNYDGGANGYITNCEINYNTAGIDDSYWALDNGNNIISFCHINYNAIGIGEYAVPRNVITKNYFENDSTGIVLEDADSIYCNRFCNNISYSLKYLVANNITISNNNWCTLDSTATEAVIYDGYDNVNYGLVYFMPLDSTCSPVITSINEITQENLPFRVYPNPASDYLTLHFAGNTAQSQIRIINLLGEVKYNSPATGAETNLNISSLAGGIYFVEVAQGNKVSRERFVKQ
jgi:hypothetical protein